MAVPVMSWELMHDLLFIVAKHHLTFVHTDLCECQFFYEKGSETSEITRRRLVLSLQG